MGLQEVRSGFFDRHHEARAIDDALCSLSNPNPFFFMAEIKNQPDLDKVAFTLVRLGPELERRFNINGEVAIYFSPWSDFQRRSFLAMTSNLGKISRGCQETVFGGEVRFSPSKKLAIVVSSDPTLGQKISEWSDDDDLVGQPMLAVISKDLLSGHGGKDIKSELMMEIRRRLGERNLYRAQKPVVADDFFGRLNMLRDLAGQIHADQNPAIFGLRRSGKTSAIRELKRTLLKQNVIITIVDLQMVDEETITTMSRSIVHELVEDLRFAKEKQLKVFVGADADKSTDAVSVVSLADIVRKIAIRNQDLRIVLAIDEVEHLETLASKNPDVVKSFLGALRSTSQISPNVSLLFSGVVNEIFRKSSLGPAEGRVDNPMFGQVAATFLKPFTRSETGALLNGIGAPMFAEWTGEAIDRVHSLTGGSPFFVRELAADIWDSLAASSSDSLTATAIIGAAQVEDSERAWSKTAAGTWSSIVGALEHHYPDAAYLLSPDVNEGSLNDWIGGEPSVKSAADCLVELGFLTRTHEKYFYSETLQSLRKLGESSGRVAIRPLADRDILAVIDGGESQTLEFKATIRVDLASNRRARHIEDVAVKTIAAFLNTDGGTLLIGVGDDSTLLGVSPDLALFKDDLDRFERWMMGDLFGTRIGQDIVTSCVRCDFVKIRGLQVVRIAVQAHQEVSLVDEEKLFVRVGNQTRQLIGRDMLLFAKQREADE